MVTVEIEAPAYGESCRQQRFPPTYGRRASCRLYREPCVGAREGVGEASVAVRVGGANEHRKTPCSEVPRLLSRSKATLAGPLW